MPTSHLKMGSYSTMWNVTTPRALCLCWRCEKAVSPKPTVALELPGKTCREINVHRITSWSASFLILGCAFTLNAQTSSGTIEGHIDDASKALVGGAQVALAGQQTP